MESMTGYGKASEEAGGIRVMAEVRKAGVERLGMVTEPVDRT